MVPNAETGPLSDVVDPILISAAVTPGVSSAREVRAKATTPAAAEPASSERRLSEVMASSQVVLNLPTYSLFLFHVGQRAHHLSQHHQHHLIGGAADGSEPAVAIGPADRRLVHETHSAPELQAGVGQFATEPSCLEFGHRRQPGHILAGYRSEERRVGKE